MRCWLFLVLSCLLGTGCVKYTIHSPKTSAIRYQGSVHGLALALSDARPEGTKFSHGRLKLKLRFEDDPGELTYLQRHVMAELAARGVPPSAAAAEQIQGKVRAFSVRNRRVSSFSPMVTFTRLSIDVVHGTETVRIAAYSKQTKTPVWGMGELEEPCFNRPVHLMVGELAAKLNRHFLGARASQDEVARLAGRVATVKGDALLQVINELGWSNQPAALAPLLQLTHDTSEEVRGTALGAIGTLGVPSSFSALRAIYEAPPSLTDRFLALKSIGDLATPEALAFLSEAARAPGDDEDEIREITALYLDARPAATSPVVATAGITPARSAAPARAKVAGPQKK